MSSDPSVDLINKYYIFDNTFALSGKELLACIYSEKQRHMQAQLDLRSSVPKEHIGVFHEKLEFHGGSLLFYTTLKGQ
jgi:hypothetical protein